MFLLPCFSVNTVSLVKIIHSIQMRANDKNPVFPNPLLYPFSLLICRPSPTTCIQHVCLWWTACTTPNLLAGWPTKGCFCLLSAQGLTSTEGGCLTRQAQWECHGAGQNVNNKSPPIEPESRSASRGHRWITSSGCAMQKGWKVHTYTLKMFILSALLHLFPIIGSQKYLNTMGFCGVQMKAMQTNQTTQTKSLTL